MCVFATGMVPLLWKWYRTNGGSVCVWCSVLCVLSGVIHWCCSCCWHASVFPGKILHVVYALFWKRSEMLYFSSRQSHRLNLLNILCKYNKFIIFAKIAYCVNNECGPNKCTWIYECHFIS